MGGFVLLAFLSLNGQVEVQELGYSGFKMKVPSGPTISLILGGVTIALWVMQLLKIWRYESQNLLADFRATQATSAGKADPANLGASIEASMIKQIAFANLVSKIFWLWLPLFADLALLASYMWITFR